MLNPNIDKVLDRCALVVVTTRMPSPMRDTDEGSKTGSRVVKVLQSCFNPEALRPLNKLKTHANRACRAVGTRLDTLQAWTVVTEKLEDLMKELEHIHGEWQTETNLLAKSIKSRVEDWATLNSADAAAIRALAPSSREILASSKFLRTSFRLRSEDIIDQASMEEEMTSLVGKVLYEINGVAEQLAREAFTLAAAKLPLRCTFVERQLGGVGGAHAELPLDGPLREAGRPLLQHEGRNTKARRHRGSFRCGWRWGSFPLLCRQLL